MTNEKIRAAIDAWTKDHPEAKDSLLFTDHSYDNSIMGVTADGHFVYDYDKMVAEYVEDEKDYLLDQEEDETDLLLDAEDWIQYNTLRSLPYAHGKAPVVINYVEDSFDDGVSGWVEFCSGEVAPKIATTMEEILKKYGGK